VRITFKTSLGLTASALLMAAAAPALAQQAIEEIIVTARQRAESLEKVPASITAFTSETLTNAGVHRAQDFVAMTPGVSIVTGTAEVGDTQINIRGINGARDAENSFAYIVDGILLTNPAAVNREYLNLQQIEVLKGPQGALYGRNAAAGAIIVTTKKPSMDKIEAEVKGTAATDNTYAGEVGISGPLGGNVAGGLYANYRKTDGYYKNVFLNSKVVDDQKEYGVSARFIVTPDDVTTLDLKGRYSEVKGASIAFNAAFALPAFAQFLNQPLFNEDVNKHTFTFQSNIRPQNFQKTVEVSAKADRDMEIGTLTAWLLYSDMKNSFTADGTSGAFGFFNADPQCIATTAALSARGYQLAPPQFLGPTPGASLFGPYTPTACDGTQFQVRNQSDISGEIRLASSAKQRLRWLVGAYGLHISREVGVNTGIDKGQGVALQLYVPPNGSNPTEQLFDDRYKSNVFAVFGNVAYDVVDNLEAALALRYDNENRKVSSLVPANARTTYLTFNPANGFTGGSPLNPALNPAINRTGVIAPQQKTFDQIEPKVSLTYTPSEQFTVYGNWGIGFKSGGFNSQGAQATVNLFINQPLGAKIGTQDQFRKEWSSAFEGGFKSKLLDNRVTFTAAGYYTEVHNMQVFEFLVGPFGLLRVVENVDKVRIYGAEANVAAQLTDELSVFAGGNALSSKILKASVRPDSVGNKSPYTADFTLNGGAQLLAPLVRDIKFLSRVDFNVVGPTWFSLIQCQNRPTLFGVPSSGCLQQRKTFATVDMRIGLQGPNWSVTGWVTNLTNDRHLAEVIPAPEFGGSFISPAALRRWGVDVSYKF
jgi:iron complex outermembrane receptor protein